MGPDHSPKPSEAAKFVERTHCATAGSRPDVLTSSSHVAVSVPAISNARGISTIGTSHLGAGLVPTKGFRTTTSSGGLTTNRDGLLTDRVRSNKTTIGLENPIVTFKRNIEYVLPEGFSWEQQQQNLHDAELAMMEMAKRNKTRDPTLPPPPPGSRAERVLKEIEEGIINPTDFRIPDLGLEPGSLLDLLHRAVLARQKRTGAYEFPPYMHRPIIELLIEAIGGENLEDEMQLFPILLKIFSEEAVFMSLTHEQAVNILFPHAPKLGSSVRLPNQPGSYFVIDRKFEDNRNNMQLPEDERGLCVAITYLSENYAKMNEGLLCRYVYDFEGMVYLFKCDYDGHRRYLLSKNKIAPGATAPKVSPAKPGQIQTTADAQAHLTVTSTKYQRVPLGENPLSAAARESYLVYRREKARVASTDFNQPEIPTSEAAENLRIRYQQEEQRIVEQTEKAKAVLESEAQKQAARAQKIMEVEQAHTAALIQQRAGRSSERPATTPVPEQATVLTQPPESSKPAPASAPSPDTKSSKIAKKPMTLRQRVLAMSSMSSGDPELDRRHRERVDAAIRHSEAVVNRIYQERLSGATNTTTIQPEENLAGTGLEVTPTSESLNEDLSPAAYRPIETSDMGGATTASLEVTQTSINEDDLRPLEARPLLIPWSTPLSSEQTLILDGVSHAWEQMLEQMRVNNEPLPEDPVGLKKKVLHSVEIAIRKGVKSPMEHIAILQAELERHVRLKRTALSIDKLEELDKQEQAKAEEEFQKQQAEAAALGEQSPESPPRSRGRSYREYREELGLETPPTPPISMRPLLVPNTIEDKLDLMRDAVIYDIEDEPGFPPELRAEIKEYKAKVRAKNIAKRKREQSQQ